MIYVISYSDRGIHMGWSVRGEYIRKAVKDFGLSFYILT